MANISEKKETVVRKCYETEEQAHKAFLKEVGQKIKQFDANSKNFHVHLYIEKDENDGKFYVTDSSDAEASDS